MLNSSIWGQLKSYLRRICEDCDVTGNDVTGSDRKWGHQNRKWKGDNFPRLLPVFPAVFSGTSLDSRYEKWNCESNLYRVTIAILPPMLNHFPSWIVQSAVINWLSGMKCLYQVRVITVFTVFRLLNDFVC